MKPTRAAEWRLTLWLAILVGASCTFTLGFACAVPLAAFGAMAALTLDLRHALLLSIAVWLVNQIVGFAVLHYPTDAGSLIWGAMLGGIAVLSTLAPLMLAPRLERAGASLAVVALACFVCAFAVYEGGLLLISATVMGGTENYTPAIIGRILAINAAAFVGLGALNLLARASGVPLGLGTMAQPASSSSAV